jgi:hypothetical protein
MPKTLFFMIITLTGSYISPTYFPHGIVAPSPIHTCARYATAAPMLYGNPFAMLAKRAGVNCIWSRI